MNIVLSAVGRRPYLARWFREALTASGIDGSIIVTDQDSSSLARACADEFLHAPASPTPAPHNGSSPACSTTTSDSPSPSTTPNSPPGPNYPPPRNGTPWYA